MSEPLSIVAASLQLAQLFTHIAIRVNKLAKNLKDAPEYVRRQLQSLDDFQTLCNSSARILRDNATHIDSVLQPQDVIFIKDLVKRAEEKVDSITTILSILQPQSNGRLELWTKAAKTVYKEKDVAGHVRELCEVQAQIDSFFVRHGWDLSAAQSKMAEANFAKLQDGQSRTDSSLIDVRQHQDGDRQILDSIQTTCTDINVSQRSVSQEMVAVGTNMETGFASLHDSSQDLQSIVRTTGSDLQAHFNLKFEELQHALAIRSRPEHIIHQSTQTSLASPGCMQIGSSTVSYFVTRNSICRCQRVGQFTRLVTIGPLEITRRQYGTHYPGCKYQNRSDAKTERQLSFKVRNEHSGFLTASLARFAVMTSSFFNGSLWFPNVVDHRDYRKAPGFVHIHEAHFKISKALGCDNAVQLIVLSMVSSKAVHECQKALKQLHSKLLEDFNVSRNWCRIETSSGRTLLHEFAKLLLNLWDIQDEVSDVVKDITSLLVEGGTSVTAISTIHTNRRQTALSVCLFPLNHFRIVSQNQLVFLRILLQHEIPAYFSHQEYSSPIPWVLVRLFVTFPDLAIEYGCTRLSLAVIERDSVQVEHLIKSGTKVNDDTQRISALSFAIGWIAGMEMLLEAGANPSQAIQYAIVYQDIPSLELLLETDYHFFEPVLGAASELIASWISTMYYGSLLDLALFYCKKAVPGSDKTVFHILIKALAAARFELGELAKANLSVSQLQDLGWTNPSDPHQLIDSAAGQVYAKLQSMGVEFPKRKLWPETSKTIYHSKYMTADIAELLFTAGFTEIDERDQCGVTPLILNTDFAFYNSVQDISPLLIWFLDHGAKKMICPQLNGNTFVHMLAAKLGREWGFGNIKYHLKEVAQWLPLALEKSAKLLPSQPTDLCQCFCSRGGCSPIRSLIGHMPHYTFGLSFKVCTYTLWKEKQQLFNFWNESCPESLAGLHSFTAFCRIELFERLGMRHTCCRLQKRDVSVRYDSFYVELPEPNEAAEFREEDRFSHLKLESLMFLYEKLDTQYSDDFEEFWKTWWLVIEDFVPAEVFLDGTRLYGETLPLPWDDGIEEIMQDIHGHITRSMSGDCMSNTGSA